MLGVRVSSSEIVDSLLVVGSSESEVEVTGKTASEVVEPMLVFGASAPRVVKLLPEVGASASTVLELEASAFKVVEPFTVGASNINVSLLRSCTFKVIVPSLSDSPRVSDSNVSLPNLGVSNSEIVGEGVSFSAIHIY